MRGMRNLLLKDTIYGLRDVFMYAEIETEKRKELVTWKRSPISEIPGNGMDLHIIPVCAD